MSAIVKHSVPLLAGLSLVSHAAIAPALYETKSWLQTGSETLMFQGGTFDIEIYDGFYTLGEPPNDAIIFFGDIDGDGVDDGGTALALSGVTATTQLEPFRVDRVRLLAAPPSDLERPFVGFTDFSFTVWWDFDDPLTIAEYTLAGYRYSRVFAATEAARESQDREIVPGVYTFEVPALGSPANSFYPSVLVSDMVEAFPGRAQTVLDTGFRFTNTFSPTGTIEFDPRGFSQLTWNGIDQFNVRSTDRVSVSMLDAMGDPFINGSGIPFPTFYLQPVERYTGEYTLPPFFFVPGDSVTAQIGIERGDFNATPFPTGYLGMRNFQVNIDFIDTYEGFARFGVFPPGTDADLTAPDADFDGDGFSNLIEFALQSDPADAGSVPATVPADIGGGAPGTFVITPLPGGFCQIAVTKRPNVGSSLSYFIEHSEDMVTWTRIPIGGNANWTEDINDATTLQVTSVNPITDPPVAGGPSGCFFRVAVVAN